MMSFKMFLLLIPLLVGCEYGGHFKEGKMLAGKQVSAETLNLGQTTYGEYCIQCHGVKGDGKGVSSAGMYPPPRDFTKGIFKFGNVAAGELPHDDDFHRIIRGGLRGTAMLPWDISDKRLDAVVQYIKTFAPEVWEGADKQPGTRFELPADPYGEARKAEAIEKGKRVYHVTAACIQCHRAYESKANISAYNKEINGSPMKPEEFASDLYSIKPQDSDYGYKALPPDFTYNLPRTAVDVPTTVTRLMYGVNGSGMPGWKDVVTDEELWALGYYVQSLQELRDTPERETLMERLKNQ
jgi:mono/diheme cytochrome c family protein